MMPTMKDKPLFIQESKRWKGLYVYCYLCKTNMLDICKKTGKSLKQCPNGDRHVFKSYVFVPGSKNQRRTKILNTRDVDEAIKMAIEFEKEVKGKLSNNKIKDEEKLNINKETSIEVQKEKNEEAKENSNSTKPILLIHCLARYYSFLRNEGVPKFRQRIRTESHLNDIERAFKHLVICLKKNGYDVNKFTIEQINDNVIGKIFEYLEELGFAGRTHNKYINFYSSLINWYNEEFELNIKNRFANIPREIVNHNPESISQSEFIALLEHIKPENGVKNYDKGVKTHRNIYRSWLKNGIKLGLLTGRRREELISMKWSNIKEKDGIKYIQLEDLKVNRIQYRIKEENKKMIFVPITNELKELLNELGYENYKNTDKYILEPELLNKRNRVMCDVLSRGFSHFYNQLNTGRNLTFKCLRKTYITNLQIFMGNGNVKVITGHSDNQVIEEHYIDKKEIAKASKNFSVFSKGNNRENELNEIRIESKNNEPQKSLEV